MCVCACFYLFACFFACLVVSLFFVCAQINLINNNSILHDIAKKIARSLYFFFTGMLYMFMHNMVALVETSITIC